MDFSLQWVPCFVNVVGICSSFADCAYEVSLLVAASSVSFSFSPSTGGPWGVIRYTLFSA